MKKILLLIALLFPLIAFSQVQFSKGVTSRDTTKITQPILGSADSVLVRENNVIKYVLKGSVFDSTAFLNGCHEIHKMHIIRTGRNKII
jgi:hypothetical protein